MIGLMASLIAGIALHDYTFLLSTVPYFLRLKSRNLSLAAFYVYILLLALTLPRASLYTYEGARLAIFASASVFLLLDEVLGGINLSRENAILTGILIISAFSDYTLTVILMTVLFYSAHRRFGKFVYYLLGWIALFGLVLIGFKTQLTDPVMQAFTIIGVGLVPLLFSEKKNVEFLEVNLREER